MSYRPWLFVLGSLTVCLAVWGTLRFYDAKAFDSDLEAAKQAIAERSAQRARERLNAALARRPEDGESLFLLGACEQALGRPQDAIAVWKRVKPDSPFAASAAMLSARIVLSRDRLGEAEPLLLDAIKGTGKHAIEARETLVNIFKIEGRFVEARQLVSGAWGAYPDPLGLLKELENLGSNNPISVVQVHQALEKAQKNAPGDDRVWLGLANLSTRTGRFDEAKRRLDACLEKRPGDRAVWRAKLDWAIAVQDEVEVESALRKLPKDAVSPPEVLTLQAWFAQKAGDAPRESRACEAMLAREPGNLRALGRLADLALAAGEVEKAASLRSRRAELNQQLYRYQESLQNPEKGQSPKTAAEAAKGAEALGRYFEAASLWTVVRKAEPANSEAKPALERLKKLDEARPAGPYVADLVAELDSLPKRGPSERTETIGKVPEFVDDAERSGLIFTFDNGVSEIHHTPETTAGGIGLIDYDSDGWLDVYLTQGGTFPPDLNAPKTTGDRLFRNLSDGRFEDVTATTGLDRFAKGYGHGVNVGDVDNDGHPDLFITRWRRYALYRNRGDGTFEDATARYGLDGDRDWPTSSAFADFDNDGDLDLYVCHYLKWDTGHPTPCFDEKRGRNTYCAPQHFASLPDHLFRNDQGRFVDVTAEAGIIDNDGRGLGVVAADLDADGLVDLFVANDKSANFLFHNQGGMKFEEVGQVASVAANADGAYQASMGIACGDTDGDGKPDLAVTNFFNEYTTLYRNHGGLIFSDATAESGLVVPTRHRLGFGAAFFDANNDGKLDLATANGHVDDFRPEVPYQMPAQLLLGLAGGKFVDATTAAGPPWQVERVARGLVVGDFDNDGRGDLLVQSLDKPLAYFHNQTEGGHWLVLSLKGTKSNRDAIGARIVVRPSGGGGAGKPLTSWRVGGGSFQSASDARLGIGLGLATQVERIEVSWPSGRVDTFGPLPVDSAYKLTEANPDPQPLRQFRSGAVQADSQGESASERRSLVLQRVPH